MDQSLKILLIDDEQVIREVFAAMLNESGYEVQTASNTWEALDLLSRVNFEIIFLDQCLKETSGVELMSRLAPAYPSAHFIIITGQVSQELEIRALRAGAEFIKKPFSTADLIKCIERIRHKIENERERQRMLLELEFRLDEKIKELGGVYFSVLSTLAQAMEKRDTGTFGHCQRVKKCVELIGVGMGMDVHCLDELKTAAMLHDIGKIGISDFILAKEGALNASELEIVRDHPGKGVEILKPLKQFESILPSILHHHENFNGSGYPHGLAGEKIPLYSRIISIGDTYDAIVSNRPYRSGGTHEKALTELTRYSGIQFDPAIVEVFIFNTSAHPGFFRALA
ncbi:MAG: response regulator [Nitrospiraceae bacterium]|nr:response regulator [Nitrospiraceae bacterium]